MAAARSVRLSARAAKSLERVDPRHRERLAEAIQELVASPLLGKKLKGEFDGLRSYRLGSFRIVYRFGRQALDVVYVDDRKDVYR